MCSWPPRRWAMGASGASRGAGQLGALGRHRVRPGARALGPVWELVGARVGGCLSSLALELVSSPTGVRPGSPARRVPGARLYPLVSAPEGPTQPSGVGGPVPGQLLGVRRPATPQMLRSRPSSMCQPRPTTQAVVAQSRGHPGLQLESARAGPGPADSESAGEPPGPSVAFLGDASWRSPGGWSRRG